MAAQDDKSHAVQCGISSRSKSDLDEASAQWGGGRREREVVAGI